MPFEKGNKLSPGRKGYEIESTQLDRMRDLLDKYIGLLETAIEDTEDEKVIKRLQLLGNDMRKILDKLHASRSDVTSQGEKLAPMYLPTELLNKNDIPPIPEPNSEGNEEVSSS